MPSLHLNDKTAADVELREPAVTSVFDDEISHVPQKYHGTSSDKHEMAVLGKKQVLRVRNLLWAYKVPEILTFIFSGTSISLPCLDLHRHVLLAGRAS